MTNLQNIFLISLVIIFIYQLLISYTSIKQLGGGIKFRKEGQPCGKGDPCDPCLECFYNVCIVPRQCDDFWSCDMRS